MPLTLVQSKTYGSTASASSHNVIFDAAPTTGNLLILAVVSDTTTSATPTGWSVANSAIDFTGTYLYYRIVSAGLSATVTVNLSSSDTCVLQAYEYSGNLASPFDVAAAAIGQSSPVSTGTTATTAQTDELLFAVVGISTTGLSSVDVTGWSNSFVQAANVLTTGGGTAVRGAVATKAVNATGTYTTSATLVNSGNADSSGIIAAFKAVILFGPTIGSVPSGTALATPAFTAKFLFFDTGDYGIGV